MMSEDLYIKLSVVVPIEESEEADAEIEALEDYISDRLEWGADPVRIVQSLTEALAVLCEAQDARDGTLH
jgi:hypothetical protein